MKCTINTPKEIEVEFRYNKKPYYLLEIKDLSIEDISLNGILYTLEELDNSDLASVTVSYWDKDGLGMARKWSCDGEYFMSNHKLKQIDK